MCQKKRREILAALGVGVGFGLAGCASNDNGGGNGDSSEDNSGNGNEEDGSNEDGGGTDNGDDGSDEDGDSTDTDDDGSDEDGDSTDTDDDGSDEDSDSTDTDDDGSVSYAVEIQNGNVSAFDSLVVTFESLELRKESETVRREGTGEEIDLTAIDTKTILETTVPPGEYAQEVIFLPVSEYQASDGSEGEFLDNDPLVTGNDFALEAGESIKAQAQISVQGKGDDWTFSSVTLRY